MYLERVVAGEFYWCVSCRYCGTTLALSKGGASPPLHDLAEPLKCYSCRSRTWYSVQECRKIQARTDGTPWAGVPDP